MSTTISYYDENAEKFTNSTVLVDISDIQNRFVSKLHKGAFILDFGCGSGRDAKFFLEQGYYVVATDGSKELCRLASDYAGIDVKHMLFQELSDIEAYDGIWACSSILHLPTDELKVVLEKMANALKDNGLIYTSFKYGVYEGERNGRHFTDMTEAKFQKLLYGIESIIIEEYWITSDARPGRGEEKWLNLLLRKR
ncbi:Methyltransferase domain-containing protein [Hathewaya proteolytica DSM 3090]|uniref:Methyltransferase domain-containing protein n=1 Tax=Hathewaya proteolytica DSM 3090 TaxID=1121331 RepID=A0A1M6KIB8_9CLOT|nr:class I SAM-dependent methyltransferase [Hathewaya proteolytica]SHJ58682.1 Methyltransferase domain-containing protein [Hathewaya proteolytica DSM 3090]